MKRLQKLTARLLTFAMLMTFIPGFALTASAAEPVSYQEYKWENNALSHETKSVTEYTLIDGIDDPTTWSGWYVVEGDVTIGSRINVSGTVNLILTDGCTLNARSGIRLSKNNTLNIYAQAGGTGRLTATGGGGQAGIGGNDARIDANNTNAGILTIHGGFITAKGGSITGGTWVTGCGAGIGGGGTSHTTWFAGDGGEVTVYNGTVTATGAANGNVNTGGGAGIGGGGTSDWNQNGATGVVTIYGGNVTARGRGNAAGIGTGGSSNYNSGDSHDATVTINGGVVTAIAGDSNIKAAINILSGRVSINGGIVFGNSSCSYGVFAINRSGKNVAKNGGMIFENANGTICGTSFEISEDFTIPEGKTLTVAEDQTLTVPEGVTLTVDGAIINNGTIVCNGTLTLKTKDSLSGTGTVSGNGIFQITAIDSSLLTVPADRVYDGTDWTDDAKATIGLSDATETICGKEFTYVTEGWTYTLVPETVKDAEVYTVTCTKPGCTDVTKTFEVTRKSIAGAKVGSFAAMTYSGNEQTPNAEVTIDGLTVTGDWSKVKNVADTTTFTAVGNFVGTIENINTGMETKAITAADVTLDGTLIYNGSKQTQNVVKVTDDVTFTVGGNTQTDAGDYKLTVYGTGNYSSSVELDWSIGKKSIENATVTLDGSPAYTGAEQTQNVTVTLDGFTVTYEVTGNKATNVKADGNYTLTVVGIGNFTGEKSLEWNIAKVDPTFTAPTKKEGLVYTGKAQELINVGSTNDGEMKYAIGSAMPTAEIPTGTDAGEYDITCVIVGDENHNNLLVSSGNDMVVTIAKATPAEIVFPEAAAITYGEKLSDSELSGGSGDGTFAWADADELPIVVNNGYEVIFTPRDADNYDYTGIELSKIVELEVAKAKPQVNAAPTAGVVRRGRGLSESDIRGGEILAADGSALSGSYSWKNADKILEKADEYIETVVFTPDDTDNYETIELEVAVSAYVPSGLQAGGDTSDKGSDQQNPIVTPVDPDKDSGTSQGADAHNCPSLEFDDLDISAWYHFDTDFVIENGIFNGMTETTFAPNGKLTRAMLVTVLYRIEGSPATNRSIPFSDVDLGAYYGSAVIWAKQNGIVNGITENEFAPNANITREQFAAIMHRYASYKGYDVSVGENTSIRSYTDFVSISEYAIPSMQYAVESGLIKGRTESTLNPLDNATRAETAAILHRFLEANK